MSGLVPWEVRGDTAVGSRQHRRVHLPEVPAEFVGEFREYEGFVPEGLRVAEEADQTTAGELVFCYDCAAFRVFVGAGPQKRLAVYGTCGSN